VLWLEIPDGTRALVLKVSSASTVVTRQTVLNVVIFAEVSIWTLVSDVQRDAAQTHGVEISLEANVDVENSVTYCCIVGREQTSQMSGINKCAFDNRTLLEGMMQACSVCAVQNEVALSVNVQIASLDGYRMLVDDR